MSSTPNDPPEERPRVDIEPRHLPEQHDELGAPFEQLNTARPEQRQPARGTGKQLNLKPRNLPERDDLGEIETIKEAMRLMVEEGQSREQVAQQLKIEPLKLRRWEKAYHDLLHTNLNEGEYHDTDAQLRDLPEEVRNRFHENWDQVLDKATERRIKVGPRRSKLMAHPLTRWLFRNEHGDLDLGVISGIAVMILGLIFASTFIRSSSKAASGQVDAIETEVVFEDSGTIEHDPVLAMNTILKFHETKTWEEKLKYVLEPEKVRPLMEDWYRKYPDQIMYNRIGYFNDTEISHDGELYMLVAIETSKTTDLPGTEKPCFMVLKRTRTGYLVDWEVSSGYQPMPFTQYREERPTTPLEFRFTLEEGNYFNYQFDPELHYCFKATYVGLDRPFYIYSEKEHKAATELDILLNEVLQPDIASEDSSTPSVGVIVKVHYPENAPADDQLILDEVVSKTWIRSYD